MAILDSAGLGEKVGGRPAWQWALMGGIGIAVLAFIRRSKTTTAGAGPVMLNPALSLLGGGGGTGGGGGGGGGCPAGQVQCPDGSCVPQGISCPNPPPGGGGGYPGHGPGDVSQCGQPAVCPDGSTVPWSVAWPCTSASQLRGIVTRLCAAAGHGCPSGQHLTVYTCHGVPTGLKVCGAGGTVEGCSSNTPATSSPAGQDHGTFQTLHTASVHPQQAVITPFGR